MLFFLFFVGCSSPLFSSSQVVVETSSGKKIVVNVEIAKTPEDRSRGLMFRQELKNGEGMLFVFPSPSQSPFWMKNTPIPLDILFVRLGKVVDMIENTRPQSEELLISEFSYDMVLEVPGGYSSGQGIQVGNTMVW